MNSFNLSIFVGGEIVDEQSRKVRLKLDLFHHFYPLMTYHSIAKERIPLIRYSQCVVNRGAYTYCPIMVFETLICLVISFISSPSRTNCHQVNPIIKCTTTIQRSRSLSFLSEDDIQATGPLENGARCPEVWGFDGTTPQDGTNENGVRKKKKLWVFTDISSNALQSVAEHQEHRDSALQATKADSGGQLEINSFFLHSFLSPLLVHFCLLPFTFISLPIKGKGKDSKKAVGDEEACPSLLDIRVGEVLEVLPHPSSDTLYVEKIDVGEEAPRQIVR